MRLFKAKFLGKKIFVNQQFLRMKTKLSSLLELIFVLLQEKKFSFELCG
jgi:hypothetical protein